MKKVRVSELAAEFGTTSEAILKLLWGRGFNARSASSPLDRYAVEWLRFEFTVDQPPPGLTTHTRPSTRGFGLPIVRRPVRSPRPARQDWWTSDSGDRPAYRFTGRRPQHRSARAVALYGTNEADRLGLDVPSIQAGLAGSPYSLPSEQTEYLVSNFLPRVAALYIRARRESQRLGEARAASLRRITRSTEIYESNRLEGLGPDLKTTDQVLHEHSLHRLADVSIAQQAIQRCLSAEPKVREVVGLGAARLLAEAYCSEPERPLTGSDIRQLHELILVGDSRRGKYKGYLNEIDGSAHVPAAPSDTPSAMAELVDWLASSSLSPLWRAAVVHAWLTHIHPFDDGNGRVARLLSNLVLIREGIPPLIVRAAGDRGAYLDALSTSDKGGDILPLARVFRRVLSRGVEELASGDVSGPLEERLSDRVPPGHVRWTRILNEFLSELAPQLLLHRLNLLYIGEVTDAELRRIGSGRPDNAWIAKVSAQAGSRDLLLHVSAPTTASRRRAPRATASLFVSVRNERPLDARQYLPVGSELFTYEFTPLVDSNSVLIRRATSFEELPVSEAAGRVADHLARAYRQLIGRPS